MMGIWQTIDNTLSKIIRFPVYLAIFCAAIIMLISVIDVIGYKIFNRGLPGTVAFIEELNIILVFAVIGFIQIERGHMNINLFEKYMSPLFKYVMKIISNILGLIVCGFFSWRTLILIQRLIASGDVKDAAAVRFPLWPFAMINCLGFVLLTLAFILCLGRTVINNSKNKP